MLANLKRPAIFAHRGASAYAPENTLAAFELAVQQGVDAIEMDAKLTADGQVVIIHDQTLERTTGHPGKVSQSTLVDIQKLDAGSQFDIAFQGEPIPSLRDVFEKLGNRTNYNIELTNYASLTDSLPEKVAELVQFYRLTDHIIFSSFNPIALIRIRRKLPRAPIGLLARPGKDGRLARSWVGYLFAYQALHIATMDASPELISLTHRRNCRAHVYTVNSEEELITLINRGVDGIFTDDPILAKRVCSTVRQGLPAQ